jgi:hypothetical protein
MKPMFVDPVHRVPRLWSNEELGRIGHLFDGDIVNVSAWRDEDKAGRRYREYFPQAHSYCLTNYKADMRGYQNQRDEIFLDLEGDLPSDLASRFDVVFNHTTLEHIYEFRRAFANLCAMSKDTLIVVVPWLQPYHGDYGDYWRFSPTAIARLMKENCMTPARITWNREAGASVYVFAVGVRSPEKWRSHFEFGWEPDSESFLTPPRDFAGRDALPKTLLERGRSLARNTGLGRLRRMLSADAPRT